MPCWGRSNVSSLPAREAKANLRTCRRLPGPRQERRAVGRLHDQPRRSRFGGDVRSADVCPHCDSERNRRRLFVHLDPQAGRHDAGCGLIQGVGEGDAALGIRGSFSWNDWAGPELPAPVCLPPDEQQCHEHPQRQRGAQRCIDHAAQAEEPLLQLERLAWRRRGLGVLRSFECDDHGRLGHPHCAPFHPVEEDRQQRTNVVRRSQGILLIDRAPAPDTVRHCDGEGFTVHRGRQVEQGRQAPQAIRRQRGGHDLRQDHHSRGGQHHAKDRILQHAEEAHAGHDLAERTVGAARIRNPPCGCPGLAVDLAGELRHDQRGDYGQKGDARTPEQQPGRRQHVPRGRPRVPLQRGARWVWEAPAQARFPARRIHRPAVREEGWKGEPLSRSSGGNL